MDWVVLLMMYSSYYAFTLYIICGVLQNFLFHVCIPIRCRIRKHSIFYRIQCCVRCTGWCTKQTSPTLYTLIYTQQYMFDTELYSKCILDTCHCICSVYRVCTAYVEYHLCTVEWYIKNSYILLTVFLLKTKYVVVYF